MYYSNSQELPLVVLIPCRKQAKIIDDIKNSIEQCNAFFKAFFKFSNPQFGGIQLQLKDWIVADILRNKDQFSSSVKAGQSAGEW